MSVACPRCRETIQADWDHCHACGLTVEQLDQLATVAGLGLDDRLTTGATEHPVADGSPGYWAEPTYGQGPIARSTGYSPPPPGVTDLRRDDTVIDLSDGEPVVKVTATGATARLPLPPSPPRHRPASGTTTILKVEVAVTIVVAVVAIAIAIVLLV